MDPTWSRWHMKSDGESGKCYIPCKLNFELSLQSLQFDQYAAQQPTHTASTPASKPTCEPSRGPSWLQKATENRLAWESTTDKGPRPELTMYLEEILLVIDWDASPEEQAEAILKWWKVRLINFCCSHSWTMLTSHWTQSNAARFPILNCIALDYLPVQGSSVPCECVFSDAGLTNTKCHAHLFPENFDAIQTVKGHYKKEQCQRQHLIAAQWAAQKKWWDDDSVAQVAKASSSWWAGRHFDFLCIYSVVPRDST